MVWSRKNSAPMLVLSIDGKDADDLLAILTEFKHEWRAGKKPSKATFTFANPDMLLTSDPRFFSNVVWQFRWGYFADMSEIFTYTVRGLSPTFADKLTVSVELFDASGAMAKSSSARNWGRVKSSVIAERLAEKYGFEKEIQTSDDERVWVQPGKVSDLQYLMDLAVQIGWETFVAGTPPTLYYRPRPYDQPPAGKLWYYSDPSERNYVLSFIPKIKSLGPSDAKAGKTDSTTGKGDGVTGESKDKKLGSTESDFQVVVIPTNEGGTRTVVVRKPPSQGDGGVGTGVDANAKSKAAADAAKANQLDRANEASSEHPMTPSIVPGKLYEWMVDQRLSGKWQCTANETTINGKSAKSSCKWKRNADNTKGKTTDKNDKDAEGNKTNAPIVYVDADTGETRVVSGNFSALGKTK